MESSSVHHVLLLIDPHNTEVCKQYLQKEFLERYGGSREICLHYPNSVRIQRFLPRRRNVKLEPFRVVPTRPNLEKLASKWKSAEVVDKTTTTAPPTVGEAPVAVEPMKVASTLEPDSKPDSKQFSSHLLRPLVSPRNDGETEAAKKVLTNKEVQAALQGTAPWYSVQQADDCIISLSAIPPRVLHEEFGKVVEALCGKQRLRAKWVVVNVCRSYNRKFEYSPDAMEAKLRLLQSKHRNLYVHYTEDKGPATKLLGLNTLPEAMGVSRSKVIVVDDDIVYSDLLVQMHMFAHQLYQPDVVGISERDSIIWSKHNPQKFDFQADYFREFQDVFHDNYTDFLYGWMTFSIRGYWVAEACRFFEEERERMPNIVKHDDLLFTLLYKTRRMHAVGMNLFFGEGNRTRLDAHCALRSESNAKRERKTLEDQALAHHGIRMSEDVQKCGEAKIAAECFWSINPRKLLYNVSNVVWDVDHRTQRQQQQTHHVDFKYMTEKWMWVTVTSFDQSLFADPMTWRVKVTTNNGSRRGQTQGVLLEIPKQPLSFQKARKATFLVEMDHALQREEWSGRLGDRTIMQTARDMTLKKQYSICTVLSAMPEMPYRFFDDGQAEEYVVKNFPPQVLAVMRKLRASAYRADLFRALYLLREGGLYLDCKMVVQRSLQRWLQGENQIFVEDVTAGCVYNALMFVSEASSSVLRKYLAEHAMYNVVHGVHGDTHLGVTGPKVLGAVVSAADCKWLNTIPSSAEWMHGGVRDKESNKMLVKSSYHGYYEEGNYLSTGHYSVLHKARQVFEEDEEKDGLGELRRFRDRQRFAQAVSSLLLRNSNHG